MKDGRILFLVVIFLHGLPALQSEESPSIETGNSSLRELIVSHFDEERVLQLFRMFEDGSGKSKLTDSERGSLMPAWSPDGKKIVYAEMTERGMSLRLTDPEGKESKQLTPPGGNLVPSWMPDSKHIVWMVSRGKGDPASDSEIHLMNTETGESRRLFSDPEQRKFSNAMPVPSPDGKQIAFVSNRSGSMRVWVSQLDGSDAKMISPPDRDYHEEIGAPIEQKVPAWSPDGKWIAHWEGVEMIHMSKFTGVRNPERDKQISSTFHVWVVGSDGKNRRNAGRGDDPTFSPDNFVTRAFPDQERGGPKIMIETKAGWKELPLVPPGSGFGRFCWKPDAGSR
jgi:dipeptidyl aminopeptidase/acylaminoacyl peptidase